MRSFADGLLSIARDDAERNPALVHRKNLAPKRDLHPHGGRAQMLYGHHSPNGVIALFQHGLEQVAAGDLHVLNHLGSSQNAAAIYSEKTNCRALVDRDGLLARRADLDQPCIPAITPRIYENDFCMPGIGLSASTSYSSEQTPW